MVCEKQRKGDVRTVLGENGRQEWKIEERRIENESRIRQAGREAVGTMLTCFGLGKLFSCKIPKNDTTRFTQ